MKRLRVYLLIICLLDIHNVPKERTHIFPNECRCRWKLSVEITKGVVTYSNMYSKRSEYPDALGRDAHALRRGDESNLSTWMSSSSD